MPRFDRTLLVILYFLSGAAALIFQAVWQRQTAIIGGTDAVNAAIVVGAFLLGLGLGSWFGGRLADRLTRRQCLMGFVGAEILVLLLAAASLPLMEDFLLNLLAEWMPLGAAQLLACLYLLLPTAAMGLSMPFLSRVIAVDLKTAGISIAGLYAANMLGAALGAFTAGWELIGNYGYGTTIAVGCALNGLVALVGLGLARRLPAGDDLPGSGIGLPPTVLSSAERTRLLGWMAAVAFAGLSIILLQLIWYRMASVLMQGLSYGLSLVLTLVLLGEALGMAAGFALVRRAERLAPRFAAVQLLMMATAILAIVGTAEILSWPWAINLSNNFWQDETQFKLFMIMACLALIILPPSFFAGMQFPLVQTAVQTDLRVVGTRAGHVMLANVAGNAAGAIVGGLIIMDYFGAAEILWGLALASVGMATVLWIGARPGRILFWFGAPIAALVAALALLPAQERLWLKLHQLPQDSVVDARETRSGLAMNVMFNPDAPVWLLYAAGHAQSQYPFWGHHAIMGMLGPLLADVPPHRALVIGFGSGGTPYGAGALSETNNIDVYEIMPQMFDMMRDLSRSDAANMQAETLRDLFADERFHLIAGDGRRRLYEGECQYDLIQTDAIRPFTANGALIFAQEFYRQILDCLTDDGISVVWGPTPLAERTFASVFPHVYAINTTDQVRILVGSRKPLSLDRARARARFESALAEGRLVFSENLQGYLRQQLVAMTFQSIDPVDPNKPRLNRYSQPTIEYILNNEGRLFGLFKLGSQ